MNCDECRRLMTADLRGWLRWRARRRLRAHIRGCRACARQFDRVMIERAVKGLENTGLPFWLGEPIVRVAEAIISQAIKQGASEVRIHPGGKGLSVEYRAAEHTCEVMQIPGFLYHLVIACLKAMAHLDVLSDDRPQRGELVGRVNGRGYCGALEVSPSDSLESLSVKLPAL